MIEQKLKDIFNDHYIIKARQQSQKISTLHPLTFSSPHSAYHFIMRLRTPYGYWQRLLRSLSIDTSLARDNAHYDSDDQAAQLISQYFYRGNLFIYPLPDHDETYAPKKERNFEQPNGDNYTFNDPSILLTSDNLKSINILNKTNAEALLMKIIKE